MGALVLGDLQEALTNCRRKAGRFEVTLVELVYALRVEGVFEVLQCERKLEDLSVCGPIRKGQRSSVI